MMAKKEPRFLRKRSPVANGIFYPERRDALTGKLASWGLVKGLDSLFQGGQAALAPHGAWELTGSAAAAAFAAVKERDNARKAAGKVFLLGPVHESCDEGIYLSESASFVTPLGNLPVDRKLTRELASCSTLFKINDAPHLSEHSLETLLPMIKYRFPKAKIIPVLMRGKRPALISSLARGLRIVLENCRDESFVAISSNVSASPDPALALSMAEEFARLLSDGDAEAFLSALAKGRVNACGGALAGALLASGFLEGEGFSNLTPHARGIVDNGETIYCGAFAAGPA